MSNFPAPPTLKREHGYNDVISSIDSYYREHILRNHAFPEDFQEILKLLESGMSRVPITNIASIENDLKAKLNCLIKTYQASKHRYIGTTTIDYLQNSNSRNMIINQNQNTLIEMNIKIDALKTAIDELQLQYSELNKKHAELETEIKELRYRVFMRCR